MVGEEVVSYFNKDVVAMIMADNSIKNRETLIKKWKT
jgi:hypothetical protein